jgi:hypothetical protein
MTLILAACGNDGGGSSADATGHHQDLGTVTGDAGGGLKFYQTCGDPVCGSPSKPPTGLPACVSETVGASCTTEGALCEPTSATCGEKLLCAKSDPKANGTCPISLARWKSDIRYVDDAKRQQLAAELLQTRLATYHYNWDTGREHLGFLIDDQPLGAKAVDPERNMVDLYGYLSLSVATLQQQQAEIEALKAEVRTLKAEARTLKQGMR